MQSWYSSDTHQTRIPFYYSCRFNFQIQYRYAPDTDAILILIQILDSRYNSNTLQARMPFCYSFRFQVQICSRHGCHSVTHSDFKFRYAPDTNVILILIRITTYRYSTDTLQTRMPFWYLFGVQIQIQFRYAPNADAILILIQTQLSDTDQTRFRHGRHSDTHCFS